MADKLPRILGLEDLLRLERPIREKREPLVYFSDREFTRLLKGVETLQLRFRILARSDHWHRHVGMPMPPDHRDASVTMKRPRH